MLKYFIEDDMSEERDCVWLTGTHYGQVHGAPETEHTIMGMAYHCRPTSRDNANTIVAIHLILRGFQRGVFARRGALVAIISVASNPCENL